MLPIDLPFSVHTELEATRLLRRRRLIIFLIALVFLVAAAILTASVVHDVRNRRELAAELGDWEEVECGGDRECQAALCPGGMVYREEEGHCTVLPGNDIS